MKSPTRAMSGRLSSDNDSSAPESLHLASLSSCSSSSTTTTTVGAMPVQHPNLHIGFIGAGNMATAMALGFLKAGLVSPSHVIASARTDATLNTFRDRVDAAVVLTKDNVTVAQRAGEKCSWDIVRMRG